jgi:hypothetical protein
MEDTTAPGEHRHDAPVNDKLDGLVDQMRADISQGHVDDVAEVLHQRLADAGIDLSDDEFDQLLSRLS